MPGEETNVAATSTPSSTPSPAAAPASPSSDSGSGSSDSGSQNQEFDFMFGEDATQSVLPSSEAPAEPAAPSAAPPIQEPAAPAPVAPVQEPPQTPAPASATDQNQGAAPKPASQSPQLSPTDPIGLALALQEHQAEAIEALATGVFRLEDKDLEALETNLSQAIPRLLAKTVVFAQQQFLTQLGNIVPQMLQNHSAVMRKHQENSDSFYAAWPSINPHAHGKLVTELGIRYRKMFPDHTLDQMVKNLGPLVLSAAGLPLTAQKTGAAPASAANTNGSQQQVRPPQQGFVPAAPGTVVQTSQAPEDPFGYMGQQG